MTIALLKVAVVGHTNTGKTSLLRTLTRDVDFGQVSSRPATTRHVEASTLMAGGAPALELFDTPGLEDSSGLLEALDGIRRARDCDWTDAIGTFLAEPEAQGGFGQEAKALRQVVACDAVFYVIDARDRVHGKHRDELEILGRCARPVLPVLNFVTDADARADLWREHLARVNMHAVVAFDTVVLDEVSELRLYEKMRTLMDRFAATLDAVIENTRRRQARLRRASAELIADLLIDAAASLRTVPDDDEAVMAEALETLKGTVRAAEQRCVDALLDLHRFRPGDVLAEDLPMVDGKWGQDLFSPESLTQFGIATGSAAATGALVGLAVDAMVGGMTLGAAAATGAALGAVVGAARSRGREILDGLRGYSELRVDDVTIELLTHRQVALTRALLRRGHAAQDRIRLAARDAEADATKPAAGALPLLSEARHRLGWSRLNPDSAADGQGGRAATRERLASVIADALSA